MKLKDVLIVDGSYLLHRVLNIPNVFELCTTSGIRSGGIFKFIQSLIIEVKRSKKYPLVCWDSGLAPRRLAADPDYKGNRVRDKSKIDYTDSKEFYRDEFIKTFKAQKKVIIEILQALNIPSYDIKGWEGDDLMYIISQMSTSSVLLSDDKDMIQALTPDIDVYRPMRQIYLKLQEYLDLEEYKSIREFVITKSIIGDPADNIPKVAEGVGEKGAKKLAKIIDSHFEDQTYLKVLTQILDIGAFVNNQPKAKRGTKIDLRELYLENHVLYEGVEFKKVTNTERLALQSFIDNHSRFLINLELIDLSRIVTTPEVLIELCAETHLRVRAEPANIALVKDLFHKYEIKSLNPDDINKVLVKLCDIIVVES